VRKQAIKSGRPMPTSASAPIAQAFPIVRRALKILADREVSPQTGLLKSTLLQLDSTFSERTYGASSFLDFVEKLAQSGLVNLKHAGRSVMVELSENAPEETSDESAGSAPAAQPLPGPSSAPGAEMPQAVPIVATESQAEGVKRAGEILKAATNARWPMYLRNVKQLLRAAEGGFDERRYGFGGLVDLVRGCQREGLVRLERDRRGGLRVFPGSALQLQRAGLPREEPTAMPADVPQSGLPVDEAEQEFSSQVVQGQTHDVQEVAAEFSDFADAEPMPAVDPTAELLGTSTRRKRPVRAAAGIARGATKAAPRRAAAPRRSRAKKAEQV
jgi:hypothetical protein